MASAVDREAAPPVEASMGTARSDARCSVVLRVCHDGAWRWSGFICWNREWGMSETDASLLPWQAVAARKRTPRSSQPAVQRPESTVCGVDTASALRL